MQLSGMLHLLTLFLPPHHPCALTAPPRPPRPPDPQLYPDKGNVCFSAGLHGWAFTLTTFAKLYAAKFGIDEDRMMGKLWGDNFFDPATKKWTTKNTGAATCMRGFVQFCYKPIQQVIDLAMADSREKLFPMLEKLQVRGGAHSRRCSAAFSPALPACWRAGLRIAHLCFSATV